MLVSFAGSILVNLLMGESLVIPFKRHDDVMLATIAWCVGILCLENEHEKHDRYIVFYLPFDLGGALVTYTPVKVLLTVMKEVQRAHKILHGVAVAWKQNPEAWIVVIICGSLKGACCL